MILSDELKDLGCILIIDKRPKKKNPFCPIYYRAKIIYFTKTFYITSRSGVISKYHVDHKGFDYCN